LWFVSLLVLSIGCLQLFSRGKHRGGEWDTRLAKDEGVVQ